MLHFWVHDRPRPQGSKRHVGRGILVESSDTATWREAVKQAAMVAREDQEGVIFPAPLPVRLAITFHFKRPKKHYHVRKIETVLRDDAPYYMTSRPDLSKLIRSTEDALTTAAVWDDDSQVTILHCHQVYNDNAQEGAAITITEAKR